MKKIVKNTLALTLITVVLGLVLGLVHEITGAKEAAGGLRGGAARCREL